MLRRRVFCWETAYTAPERAKRKPAARRADTGSCGRVLYEMFTGQTAFRRGTAAETLAAVLKEEPDCSRLPGASPPQIPTLLHRSLREGVKRSSQAIGDARILLDEILSAKSQEELIGSAAHSAKQRRLRIL